MHACPKCGSTDIAVQEGALWTLDCRKCGHNEAGAAEFPLSLLNVETCEKDYRVVFQLSSVRQILAARTIAPELSRLSTAEALEAARSNGLSLSVSPVAFGLAREYIAKAKAAGLKATMHQLDNT